jgi:hypothetical protein
MRAWIACLLLSGAFLAFDILAIGITSIIIWRFVLVLLALAAVFRAIGFVLGWFWRRPLPNESSIQRWRSRRRA